MTRRKGHKFDRQSWKTRCTPISKWVAVEIHPINGDIVCTNCGATVREAAAEAEDAASLEVLDGIGIDIGSREV